MGRPCFCCGGCEKCEKCISANSFPAFEYALLICNINAAKDDEFDLYLNGVYFGPVSELGENRCKGKWFVTSDQVIEKIKNSKDNKCNASDVAPPICCVENTTSIKALNEDQKKAFFDDKFTVFLKNKKNNNNGNFGYIAIWRINKNSVCQIANGEYSGDSGRDINSSLNSKQYICCCDKSFSKLVFQISLAADIEKYHRSQTIICRPFDDPQGTTVLNAHPAPCRIVSINGSYALNTAEIDSYPCKKTTIGSIRTEGVIIAANQLEIYYCPAYFPSIGPGFDECYKKLCLSNPYIYYLDQGYRKTGARKRCIDNNSLPEQIPSRPEVTKIEQIKVEVTGIE